MLLAGVLPTLQMLLNQGQRLGGALSRPAPGPRCGQTLLTDVAANLVQSGGHGVPYHGLQFVRDKLHSQAANPTDQQSAHILLPSVASFRWSEVTERPCHQLWHSRMDVQPPRNRADLTLRCHDVDHLLDQDRRVRPNDVKA